MSAFLEELGGRFLQEALGFGVGTVIAEPLRPFVEDLVHTAWETHPVRVLEPADLANSVVQGVRDLDSAADEAQLSGINRERFDELVHVAGMPIAPDQALDLWNRGEIAEGEVDTALRQSRLKPEWVDRFKLLRHAILQAADLAEMVVQGVLPQDEARRRSAMLGLAGDDFDRLVRLAGNPPGPEQMVELWQRGEIDEADVDRALVQSRLKPEWVETYKLLAHRPATTPQIVTAVVKQQVTMAEGITLAAKNGTDEVTFRLLVRAAGRPIAIGQALQLFNRGFYDRADVEQVVARSDVRTEYTDAIMRLAVRYPSLYQVKQLVQTGAVDDAYATRLLREQGYPEQLAAGVVAAGHSSKLHGTKELTRAQVVELYQVRALDRGEALQLLGGIGYDEHDVGLMLGLADYQRDRQFRSAAVNVVRARYLQRDIDEPTASSTLDAIGLPAEERDRYLDLWGFDLDANPRLLTLAQLVAAHKAGLLDDQQFADYLPRLGYVEPELSLVVALHTSR